MPLDDSPVPDDVTFLTSPMDDATRLRLLEAAVEHAGEAIILLEAKPAGPGRRVVYTNRAFTRLTGYTPDEIEGESLYRLKGPDTDQAALDRIAEAMDHGRPVTEQLLNYRKDGSTFWAECTLAPVSASEGQPPFFVSIQRDVTTMRDAARRLRRSENRYRALMDSYPHGAIVLFDRSLRYILAGGQDLQRVGLSPNHLIGRTVWEVFPRDLAVRIGAIYARALGGETVVDELEYNRQTYLTHVTPVHEEKGQVQVGMMVTLNITERKNALEALQQSEARFRMVAEHMRDLVSLHTPDGTYEWVSPSVRSILGYDAAALIGTDPYEYIHPDDRERVRRQGHRPLFRGKEGTRITHRMRHANGTYLWVETLIQALTDDRGMVLQLLSTARDVTARKEYEQEILAAKEQAEEMSRLKSAFLANMSHEVRTPLTNILGFAEVLLERVEGEEHGFVSLIRDGSTRLLHMLNSLLDLARLESDSVTLRLETVDVARAAREAVRLFAPRAEAKGLTLTLTGAETPAVLMSDRMAVERVLENLIGNACKFTDAGTVAVRLKTTDTHVDLTVKDTGVGIEADFLPHVFEAFQQESSGFGRSFEGVGLGLSICRHLVERMDGRIAVESEKGVGSTFRVTLPKRSERSM